eukprot:GSMAST32.ASY1.ANO1.819.1 assembled CDS
MKTNVDFPKSSSKQIQPRSKAEYTTANNRRTSRNAAALTSTGKSITVSSRQRGNPILKHIRVVSWHFSDIKIDADYLLGNGVCALFLSLKYHMLHPKYIIDRCTKISPHKFKNRLIICHVDVDDNESSLLQLMKLCERTAYTLILACTFFFFTIFVFFSTKFCT